MPGRRLPKQPAKSNAPRRGLRKRWPGKATSRALRTPQAQSKPIAAPAQTPPKKPGRPPVINADLFAEIGKKVAKGLTEEQACLVLGVNHNTFNSAKQRPEFALAYKTSQAQFVDVATDAIGAGIQGWQGLAWLLERRHKGQFARVELQVQGTPLGNAFLLSPEDLNELRAVARREFVPGGSMAAKQRSKVHEN